MARRKRKSAHRKARRGRKLNLRRVRRLRRNGPSAPASKKADVILGAIAAGGTPPKRRRRRARRVKASRVRRHRSRRFAKRRATSKRLLKRVRSLRRRAKRAAPRSIRRSVALTQAKRLSTLRRVTLRGGKISRSPVYKAMHVKSNPGLKGMWVAAKHLAPQLGAGAVAMVGIAFLGKKLGDMLTTTADPAEVQAAAAATPAAVVAAPAATAGLGAIRPFFLTDGKPGKLVAYVPAASTAFLAVGSYLLANKFAPKYKGSIALGGLLAAVIQGLGALKASQDAAAAPGLAAKALNALGLGDYTTVGGRAYADGGVFRDVRGLSGRSYAEGGMFRDIGALPEARDGGAYSNRRPRRGEMDNATEWAMNGAPEARDGGAYSNRRPRRGETDNATEWASGEGGILNGGMFRGDSR